MTGVQIGIQNRRAGITSGELSAEFNFIHGAHTLKLGGSHLRFHANEMARRDASGQFDFQVMRLGFDAVGTVRDSVPFTLQQGLPPGAMAAPKEKEEDVTLAFGLPGSGLGGGFGIATAGSSDREMQFALKLFY